MRVYYINLASRTDRRQAMEAQLAALGMDATRIAALGEADISPADRELYCNPRRHRWLTAPELACNYSHALALRLVAGGPDPFGLIFEDDVILSAALPAFLKAFETAPPAVDVLKLDASPFALRISTEPAATVGGVTVRRLLSNGPGTGGVIVSRAAAAVIAESPELRWRPIDAMLFNPYRPLPRRLVVRNADPGLCTHPEYIDPQRATASTLRPARELRLASVRSHFGRFLHRLAGVYDREIRMGIPKTWDAWRRGAEKRVIPYRPD